MPTSTRTENVSVPDFESPVSSAPIGTDELLLADISTTTKLLVRSDEEQFGVKYGASTMVADALVSGSRPDEWSIIGTAEACGTAAARVASRPTLSRAAPCMRSSWDSAPVEVTAGAG